MTTPLPIPLNDRLSIVYVIQIVYFTMCVSISVYPLLSRFPTQVSAYETIPFLFMSIFFQLFLGAVGGDGDDGDENSKEKEEEAERERQEAIREAEERRKEKHRKMEEEREKMRQEIRDKVSVFVCLNLKIHSRCQNVSCVDA